MKIIHMFFGCLFVFFLGIFIGGSSLSNHQELYDKEFKSHVKACMEYAYFEGQKDYSSGDIRIKDGRYIKSCWDGQDLSGLVWDGTKEMSYNLRLVWSYK